MKQERTKELDLHWSGMWFCNTCELYTGQFYLHEDHDTVFLDNRRDVRCNYCGSENHVRLNCPKLLNLFGGACS